MNAIARFISSGSARFAPCSGRSDAMMNCGEPLPPYWSLLHDDAGSGVTAACLLDLPAAVATTASVAAAASTAASPMRFFKPSLLLAWITRSASDGEYADTPSAFQGICSGNRGGTPG